MERKLRNGICDFSSTVSPRCPNRKWIKSIEVQFRSGVVDIIGNSAIMIMAGNSAQNSDREKERDGERAKARERESGARRPGECCKRREREREKEINGRTETANEGNS